MTQHSVALSTMEAEYFAVCKATQEAINLRMLFEESGMKVDNPLGIKEEITCFDVRSCLVRQWVEDGELVLESVEAVPVSV